MASLTAHFSAMARNNRWSNHVLLRAVCALQPGEFEAERTSFFPSIAETLNHNLAIDRYYLDALEEGGVGPAAFHVFESYGDSQALADALAHGHCMLAVHLNGNSNISENSKNALRAAWNASNGRPTRLVLDPEPAKP